ncbi:MAG: hypothetical protein AAF617_08330 [Bacteroidota bacterium]
MKQILAICLLLTVAICQAQFQNLALLKGTAKVTKGTSTASLESICVNSQLDEPKNMAYTYIANNNTIKLLIDGVVYEGGLAAAIAEGLIELIVENSTKVYIKVSPSLKFKDSVEVVVEELTSISENPESVNKSNLEVIKKMNPAIFDADISASVRETLYWEANALFELGYLKEGVSIAAATQNFKNEYPYITLDPLFAAEDPSYPVSLFIYNIFYVNKEMNLVGKEATLQSFMAELKKLQEKFPKSNPSEVFQILKLSSSVSTAVENLNGKAKYRAKFDGSGKFIFDDTDDFIKVYQELEACANPTICISYGEASFSVECEGVSLEISTTGDFTVSASQNGKSQSVTFNMIDAAFPTTKKITLTQECTTSKSVLTYQQLLQDLNTMEDATKEYVIENSADIICLYKEAKDSKENTDCNVGFTLCIGESSSMTLELSCDDKKISTSASGGSFSFSSSQGGVGRGISF